jgi:hypothetical protein
MTILMIVVTYHCFTMLAQADDTDQAAVYLGDEISVPITFTSSEPVTAVDYTITINNGTLSSLTCGGPGFENTEVSDGTHCVIFNPNGMIQGSIGNVVVSTNSIGSLTVGATGFASNRNGERPESFNISQPSFTVVNDLVFDNKINIPIVCSAEQAFNAADFTVEVSGGMLMELSCGGAEFQDIGAVSSPRCVVLNLMGNGSTGGTLATATVLTTEPGNLTISVKSELSRSDGISPENGVCRGLNIICKSQKQFL